MAAAGKGKFEVTFNFIGVGEQSTIVYAATEEDAIAKARARYSPAVPDDVPDTAVNVGPGGRRKGSGVKEGSKRTNSPRTIKKQIKWSKKEWLKIEKAAAAAGQTVADWQREKLLAAADSEETKCQ